MSWCHLETARYYFTDEKSLGLFDAFCEVQGVHKPRNFEKYCHLTQMHPKLALQYKNFMLHFNDKNRKRFLYGAGGRCREFLEREEAYRFFFSLPEGNWHWDGIIDANIKGYRCGLPIVSLNEFMNEHKDATVINTVFDLSANNNINELLFKNNISFITLRDLENYIAGQYFDLPHALSSDGGGGLLACRIL